MTELETLRAALATMNAVSLHQCNRLPWQLADAGAYPFKMAVHPLTCGVKSSHGNLYPFWNGERVQLLCPDCDYTQDNAAGM